MKVALSTIGENTEDSAEYQDQALYAFVLDSHCFMIEDCWKLTRVGTVFFQLDWRDDISLKQRCCPFQCLYPGEISQENMIVMAKYTPNFDQEIWKYHGLEILGVEYNWRK